MPRRRVFIDVGPLRRSKDFRYLYIGEMVSTVGSGLTTVAVPLQIYGLTHSSLQVGLVSLAQLLPLVLCSFAGGATADAYDRRKILLLAELAMAGCSIGLAFNATLGHHPEVWPLYAFTASAAGFSAFESPARVAAAAGVLSASDMAQMSALWQVLFQVSTVVGPFLAGVVIALAGLGAAYWADAATFAAAFAGAWLLRPMPPAHRGRVLGLKAVKEGLSHLGRDQALQGIYLIDLAAMVFGMPRALFPALGTVRFHGGARTVSYLYTAVGAGALLGALTSGWVSHLRRQGRAVVIAVVVWGLAIVAVGFVRSLPLALAFLALAGWADVLSAVFRNAILQLSVPDRLRGRMNAIQIAVVAGGPRLGDLESGGVATLVSPAFSVVSGGLACIGAAVIMTAALPAFWRLRLARDGSLETRASPGQGSGDEPFGRGVSPAAPD